MRQDSLRVEPVDNHHPAWPQVLAAVFKTGNREAVLLREDGWLSTRQTILAAFDGDQLVGHLCFRIEPMRTELGQMRMMSRVDSFAVTEPHGDHAIAEMLQEVADYRAQMMQCAPPTLRVKRTA